MRRTVPAPPLRRNAMTLRLGKSGSARRSLASVWSAALVHRGADPLDLEQHVLFLVEAGQHDGDVRCLLGRCLLGPRVLGFGRESAHDRRGY
jgi:hypothetical protein